MNEIWKPVVGYEGIYEVSNTGKVKSILRFVTSKVGKTRPYKEKILKPTFCNQGYGRVTLFEDGKRVRHKVHRLVALAFIPNPENKPHVNHIDARTSNNSVYNLEWCTASENIKHAYKIGNACHKRSNHNQAKLVLHLETGIYYGCISDCADALGMAQSALSKQIRNIRGWKNTRNVVVV